MGYASGYTLDLYCDKKSTKHGFEEFPHNYYSDEKNCKSVAFRVARRHGWRISRNRDYAICPKCSGKKWKE